MTDVRYNVIFEGRLVPGADPAAVRTSLARLFRMDAARVEALFGGRRVILKKDADGETAAKFRLALQKAGAECRLEPIGEIEEVVAAPPPPDPAPQPAAPAAGAAAPAVSAGGEASGDMELVGTIRTGGEGFSGAFEVAPVGADMGESRPAAPPVEPDISGLSVAPPGTELEELPGPPPVAVPDISHLSVLPLDD